MAVRRAIKTFQELFEAAKYCRKLAPLWSPVYPAILLRAIRLCHRQRFLPDEAFRFGLFNPDLSDGELSKYISRRKLTKVQEAINPVSWATLLKNKGIFYRYCMALGVPIPKLYAIFLKKVAGWSYDGSVLTSREDWKKFFDCQLPATFVVKPTQGAYGKGLNIFNRSNKKFIDVSGREYESADLYDTLLSDPQHESFIIQEQLKNHPELLRLTGVEFLQTVRIITIVDRENQCRIIHAHLKMITGQSIADNFEHGLSGNIESLVSLTDGQLKPAVTMSPDGLGVHTIPDHPKTKIAFNHFRLPLWNQACRLVKEIAPNVLPIRTIAWDVGLTPDGPYIVEGNIWWYPPNQHRRMDVILNELS
jgi:hypothetical protein